MVRFTEGKIESVQEEIFVFIAGNAGCNVRTMVKALSQKLHVSPNTVSGIYKRMVNDGSIEVIKPSGFHGGNEPFKLYLKQTDLKKELDSISAQLQAYEKSFNTFFPNMRKRKLLIWKKTDGVKYQVMSKAVQADFSIFCFMIDNMFNNISAIHMAKSCGLTPSSHNGLIDDLSKRIMEWIIKSINYYLDSQSKVHNRTRWNCLIQLRTQLRWLLIIETKKPDLFYNKEWLKDGVIY